MLHSLQIRSLHFHVRDKHICGERTDVAFLKQQYVSYDHGTSTSRYNHKDGDMKTTNFGQLVNNQF